MQNASMSGPETHKDIFHMFHSRVNQTLCVEKDDPTRPEVRGGWSYRPVMRPSHSTSGLVPKVQLAFCDALPLTWWCQATGSSCQSSCTHAAEGRFPFLTELMD